MQSAPIPANEAARLNALRRLLILDTDPEERFDRITRLASRLFRTPLALISLIDADRQWFKSRIGLTDSETERRASFCAHAVGADQALIVPDAHADDRFHDNPVVLSGPRIRFYAGEVLRSREGLPLGTLCVADTAPREFSTEDQAVLRELAAIAQDEINAISEVRLAELLRLSEERFSLLVEASDQGFFDNNRAKGDVYLSAQWKRILGYADHELDGNALNWIDLVHPLDALRIQGTPSQPGSKVRPYHLEFRMRHKDGGWRWVRSQGVSIHQASTGEMLRSLGFHTDITAQRELEAQARLQELVVRHISDGICVSDSILADGGPHIVYVNPAMEEMMGYDSSELIGRSPAIFHGPLTDATHVEGWRASLEKGETYLGEVFNYRKDGTPIEVEWQVSPVRDKSQVITHWVALRRDISARKQTERELQKAKQSAESASQAKTQFLANMSHEIRTPLNGIIGMAELLASSDLADGQRDYIETILSSSDNLLTIINDVLDYSKIEHGGMELDSRPFSPADLVDEVVGLLSYRAADKGLELTAVVAPSTPRRMLGDPNRLRQILLNLVANAVKFTTQGEVTVELSGQSDPVGSTPSLRIEVRDTGIGIPADRMDRLFKLFSQVDSSTTRRFGGTGLGLAISQRLAGLMGGQIQVLSKMGVGSTFILELNLPATEEPTPDERPALAGKRVLVVDDNATNRRMLALHLGDWGAKVDLADGADTALTLLRGAPGYDVAIFDLQMPGRDGLGLAADLQSLPSSVKRPALILCSSIGEKFEPARLRPLGIEAFLQKPVRRAALGASLSQVLSAKSLTSLATAPAKSPSGARPGRETGNLRVLLAEDNLVNRKVASAILSQLGYHPDIAVNGLQAVELARRQPYDVILMDVHMPEMDGLTATMELRRNPPQHGFPFIIALTADALSGDREKCLAAGMDHYLTKPLRTEDLRLALEQFKAPGPTA